MASAKGARAKRSGRVLIIVGALFVCAALALAAYNVLDSQRAGDAAQGVLDELRSGAPSSGQVDGMPQAAAGGYDCIGEISVPALGIDLPVLATWDYDRLRVAPCRYSGSLDDSDLVICAHDYASHFGPLQGVAIGVDVYFASVDGRTVHYIVSNRETLAPTAVEQMVGNLNNGEAGSSWDLTLFTCDWDGRTRCTVRCVRQAS